MGGDITRAQDNITTLLNGLKYYSLEVTIGMNQYYIQDYEQDAVDLFTITMSILTHRNKST
jgi:hypothetical protein